jgi:hypothetical protein
MHSQVQLCVIFAFALSTSIARHYGQGSVQLTKKANKLEEGIFGFGESLVFETLNVNTPPTSKEECISKAVQSVCNTQTHECRCNDVKEKEYVSLFKGFFSSNVGGKNKLYGYDIKLDFVVYDNVKRLQDTAALDKKITSLEIKEAHYPFSNTTLGLKLGGTHRNFLSFEHSTCKIIEYVCKDSNTDTGISLHEIDLKLGKGSCYKETVAECEPVNIGEKGAGIFHKIKEGMCTLDMNSCDYGSVKKGIFEPNVEYCLGDANKINEGICKYHPKNCEGYSVSDSKCNIKVSESLDERAIEFPNYQRAEFN